MKTLIFIVLFALSVQLNSSSVPPAPVARNNLLGTKECTWGPSYWCQNLTAAAGCHATKHCIQTVWIHKQLPPDTSSVCQTCLDMVKQARDQLDSNETQELIKQVFEGSCALLHVKPIVKECDKIADEYIPDLIDTLASEMNPQVVCSVAGLCNNERVHKLLESETKVVKKMAPSNCEGCHTVVSLLEKRFNSMTHDEVLQAFLKVCGRMSSLSDACSNIVITYFTEIYNHLQENLNPRDVCLMTGECSAQFHTHTNVEITPISHIGYVPVNNAQDDLPCDLCEQLVGHLRDLLVANTTEDEFKKVLEGLCKQTKSFKDECISLVDQYYQLAYSFLVSELNSTVVCSLAGICPRPGQLSLDAPIAPLLPIETANKALTITADKKPLHYVNMGMEGSSLEIMQSPEQSQLPIERLMPHSIQVIYDKQLCVFCEYFLHYLQEVISSPSTEDEIKNEIDKLCLKLPSTVNETCVAFVNTYGNAAAALIAQEIDPTTICPLLRICPAPDSKDVEIFMHVEKENDKCPLCLFAVTKLEEMVKDNKTKANIKDALDKLCSHLNQNLAEECTDFVSTYTDELIEMLIADLTPQEVCVYLKLCTDKKRPHSAEKLEPRIVFGGEIETNEIPDFTANGKFVRQHYQNGPDTANPQCVLCEFIMSQIENELKDNKTDEAIKKAVHNVCNLLPKTVKTDCNNFVNQYADTIIQLLIQTLEPQEICSMMNLCASKNLMLKSNIIDCAICRTTVIAIDKILGNPEVDHNIEHILEKACRALPMKNRARCTELIDLYGKNIFDLIIHFGNSRKVCEEIGLCSGEVSHVYTGELVGNSKCTWGPSYWCAEEANALNCGHGAITHCQQKVWLAEKPPK